MDYILHVCSSQQNRFVCVNTELLGCFGKPKEYNFSSFVILSVKILFLSKNSQLNLHIKMHNDKQPSHAIQQRIIRLKYQFPPRNAIIRIAFGDAAG
jgi:hypothetical protein